MLIACVKVGTKYGDDYVQKLKDGAARHGGHDFVCLTDKPVDGVTCEEAPNLPGWWAKVGLFRLKRPLLYFDLDVVITGDLSRAMAWDGFGILKDWWTPGFNSSVMRLTGDEFYIWEKFRPGIMSMVPGDQDYITGMMPEARTFPPDWFPSYKGDRCYSHPPAGAMAVVFHGFPKPHQCGGWVSDHWKQETICRPK